jgi:very-short-patch-repair endonuclease
MVEVAREFRKVPTPSEATLWSLLRDRQIDRVKFRRQQPIGPFVVDFLAPRQRLIVEVDGPVHEFHTKADRERQILLESLGFRFLRVMSDEVENDSVGTLEKIRCALREASPVQRGASMDETPEG